MAANPDEARRAFLLRMLAAGLFAALPSAHAEGKLPRKLPPEKSIYSLKGDLVINGQAATAESMISCNDTLTTGPDSQVFFVVGKDAFILHENSELTLSGSELLVEGLRLITGGLLSVFGKSQHQIETPLATIGIRGTGIYVESVPSLTYVCTCYGTTSITSAVNPDATEIIQSKHHDEPRYVSDDGRIYLASMINHTDEELALIEALVGRTPPFALYDESYSGPRRY